MPEQHPPPVDPRAVRTTGRRRVRVLTAGLAAAAVAGTGAIAVVAAVEDSDSATTANSTATASPSETASTGDQQSWTPSGATVTQGSDGSAAATSGGS